jgi:hypothetical protein
MKEERTSFAAVILSTAACLSPLLYGGAYLAMVKPPNSNNDGTSSTIQIDPAYRFGGRASEIFFYPAYWADQWMRPGYWRQNFIYTR